MIRWGRRLRWWWTRGPVRLEAARLRRGGQPVDALRVLVGPHACARVLLESIRTFPDPVERIEFYRSLVRSLTAPRR